MKKGANPDQAILLAEQTASNTAKTFSQNIIGAVTGLIAPQSKSIIISHNIVRKIVQIIFALTY